jgi:hypothetical protein
VTGPAPDRPATDRPATDWLWEEIVYIAYYLHWSFDSILDLDHASRARVIDEIGKINTRLSADAGFDEETADWASALR